ncbi:hypothetical protein Drose_24805 [Dactylosporangium roseum]|uniref:ChrR-like cupin domain-containing protein n=1 Tax=Dactylosporangium roseum TaxID=47989 RepID=A0ABY5Z014_9ACTN|nr:hypothetical protein [Dactylosporangium roseum]UWZ34438.1 hypothetical protein Drose_24805 [Dactylosporangium roseum]
MRPHRDLSWDELPASRARPGIDARAFVVGDSDDPAGAPKVIRVRFEPWVRVGMHTHDTDYAEIVLAGSQRVGRRWYGPGDIRVVRAGVVYGPLTSGPDGATVLIMFADGARSPMVPPRRDGVPVPVEFVEAEPEPPVATS